MSGRRDPLRTRRVMLILRAIGVGGRGLAGLLPLLTVLAACDSGGTGPDEKRIGPEGGTASLAGGSVTLSIPADALSAGLRLFATRASSYPPSDLMVAESVYDLQPSGVGFARLAWLTLTYDPGRLPDGVKESELRLFKVVGGRWELVVNATVDTEAHTVSGSVWSLGTFGAMGVPVAQVLVSPGSYTLEQGRTKGLTAVGLDASGMSLPERGITWTSSNEIVATVNADGLVSAVGVGSATVTATAEGKVAYSRISTWSCDWQTEIPVTECRALVDWFNGANQEDWRASPDWVPTPYPCGWLGVTCDGGSVSVLGPYRGTLPGFISSSLGQLTNLQEVRLSNQLTGPIPKSLGSLSKLTVLDLFGNNLSGPIPSELENLAALTVLRLANNALSGPIPPGLGSLSNLTDLDLRWNELSGAIPSELASLSSLTHLGLMANHLSGSIPIELSGLSDLSDLSLSFNQLTGHIPPDLGKLSNLTSLGLAWNQLTGPIPAEIGSLVNLNGLFLNDNELSGIIPLPVAQLGGQIQARPQGAHECLFAPSGNTGLSMPDNQEYRAADLNGDGKICGVGIGSG